MKFRCPHCECVSEIPEPPKHPDYAVLGHPPDCHECHLALAREYERKRHP